MLMIESAKSTFIEAQRSNECIEFVSGFLNIIQLGVLNFLFTTQAYVQGGEWKKLILIDWNEYQESTYKHWL